LSTRSAGSKGIDLELLDAGAEDELGLLVEALHDCQDLSWSGLEATLSGPAGNPRMHVVMHKIVSRQLLAGPGRRCSGWPDGALQDR
jgi:hypothetical protein